MRRAFLDTLLGALLLSFALGGSAPAWAQLAVEPESLAVALAPGEQAERVLTLTNVGSEAASFCLSFARPLQRVGAGLRLSEAAAGSACGPLGEVLLYVDADDLGFGWSPYGLTMTPDGRLFVAEVYDDRTNEFTPSLGLVRSFEHPTVAELTPFALTHGVTYNPETGTLWWMNVEQQGFDFRRALLLEGTLDGVATGRRIELPPLMTATSPEPLLPSRLSYDPAAHRYYFSGYSFAEDSTTVWAVDTLGAVVPGYPMRQTAYPEAVVIGPDAHGGAGGEPEAVRLELAASLAGGDGFDRLVVVDPWGRDLSAETPLPDLSGGTQAGGIEGEPLRSRTDPNGLLYSAFGNFDTHGIVGIRPHPLPPSWLAVSAWEGEMEPGESTEIALTFSSGTREIGSAYTAAVQVFEAATGTAVEVPLTFEVVPVTAGEDEADASAALSLGVFPNPARGAATAVLALPEAAEIRLAVFDVLGRRVAVLAEGLLAEGHHRFGLGATLPAGVYLVQASGDGFTASRRLTVVR